MTVFSNNQGEIDAATAAIDGALTVIAELGAELAELKSQEGADKLDWSGLDAKIAALNATVTAASVSAPVVDVSALQVAGNYAAPPATGPATDAGTLPTTDLPTLHDGDQTAAGAPVPDGDTTPLAVIGELDAPEEKPDGKSLYKHTGTDPIDATAWPAAGLTAADDGAALYTYSGDIAGGEPTGASAEWTVYTGLIGPADDPATA